MADQQLNSKIQISEKDSKKGFHLLLTNGSLICSRNNTYVVPNYCLNVLKKNKVDFKVQK